MAESSHCERLKCVSDQCSNGWRDTATRARRRVLDSRDVCGVSSNRSASAHSRYERRLALACASALRTFSALPHRGRRVRTGHDALASPSCRQNGARELMTQQAHPLSAAPDMTEADLAELRGAVQSLEHPSLAARLTNMVGKPIELIGYALPASASQVITTATSKALNMALEVALRSIHQAPRAGSQLLHEALATASGAAGGAFGLAALPIELP